MKECSVVNCDRKVTAKGLCSAHWQRARKGLDLTAPVVQVVKLDEHPECFHPGCFRKRGKYGKFCQLHYQRARVKTDMDAPLRQVREPGYGGFTAWRTDHRGYIMRKARIAPGQWVRESQHRVVMADKLGRELLPHENVHHINGDRADNRPENLELWNTSQPAGQRVIDKLDWAREILAQYEKEESMLRNIKHIAGVVGDLGGIIK